MVGDYSSILPIETSRSRHLGRDDGDRERSLQVAATLDTRGDVANELKGLVERAPQALEGQ
jgi:hypothetical protein